MDNQAYFDLAVEHLARQNALCVGVTDDGEMAFTQLQARGPGGVPELASAVGFLIPRSLYSPLMEQAGSLTELFEG